MPTEATAPESTRRSFLKTAGALGTGLYLAGAATNRVSAQEKKEALPTGSGEKSGPFWADLVHIGYNMWSDREAPEWKLPYVSAKPFLRFDESLWNDILDRLAAAGANMIVLDLGEGVRYDSHPELAVKGSWTPEKLRAELAKVRAKGIEPIPKMNFSACHDAWLGPYSRQLSTPAYYAVCSDLIAEVQTLFDKPRFFHLGMDEEDAANQVHYDYAVVRQHDLWWNDFNFLIEQVAKGGARPWIWSDYCWHHPDLFFERMPKSVLQSNWYYGDAFKKSDTGVKAYLDLEEKGYDQVPTGSNWSSPKSFGGTVEHCAQWISAPHLKGFLQTVWKPTLEECRDRHMAAIDQIAAARKAYLDASKKTK